MSRSSKKYFELGRNFAAEFVVIVLGVLAALAVESWSEDREDRVLEELYLSRLQVDLRNDLEQIGRARWASFAQARATTTLLFSLDDPLASEVPTFTESAESIDFTVPATKVISDTTMGELVWMAKRFRALVPSQSTYQEMLATGRFQVINDDLLRASVIEYYSLATDGGDFAEWVAEPTESLDAVLQPTGFTAFDFQYLDDPLPMLREVEGLPFVLRDIRRRSLRQVWFLEQVDEKATELTNKIDEYMTNR